MDEKLRGKEYHEDRVIGASGQRVIGRAKPKALHTLFSGGTEEFGKADQFDVQTLPRMTLM
jgi:hypothetical protein